MNITIDHSSRPTWSRGIVYGGRIICQFSSSHVKSNGIFLGDNPLDFTTPTLLVQITIIILLSRAGILLGPSLMSHEWLLADKIFPPAGTLVLRTFGNFGFMLHLFGLGVNMDVTMLKGTGKKAVLIGLSSLFLSAFFGFLGLNIVAKSLIENSTDEDGTKYEIPLLIIVSSVTSFLVVVSNLMDLNLVNSDLGSLASSAAVISDACGWFFVIFVGNIAVAGDRYKKSDAVYAALSIALYYWSVFCILRPIVLVFIKKTPDGKQLKESHFFVIVIFVLFIGYMGEHIGQHAWLGIFLFGLSLPSGPPLGYMFIQKFDTVASSLLLPVYYAIGGLRVNIYKLNPITSPLLAFVILMNYFGKIVGVLLASLSLKLPFRFSMSLALIMASKGIMEVITYGSLKDGMKLYDPSRRYTSNKLHSILSSGQRGIFRMVVCIYNEDNVPSMLKVLEASNPTRESPLWTSILQLTELVGHRKAIVMPHFKNRGNKPTGKLTRTYSERIVNAFNILEKHHGHNHVQVQHFTVVAPYATMHNDICTVAHDKGASIIILPFHKIWTVDGTVDDSFSSIRKVNRNVLMKSPCSVGILVDRGQMKGSNITAVLQENHTLYSIALLFLGGVDDYEALVYARRMAEHRSVKLLVIWIKVSHDLSKSEAEMHFDSEMMNEFLVSVESKENIRYEEREVEDGTGTTSIARSLEEHIDLVMVGRHHHHDSPALLGLADWSDCPELGAMGDMLSTWDFHFSVLIVQQQQQLSKREDDTESKGVKESVHSLDAKSYK
ncbi:hypothetical protein V2J09_008180 [Rumex salicifolius]